MKTETTDSSSKRSASDIISGTEKKIKIDEDVDVDVDVDTKGNLPINMLK